MDKTPSQESVEAQYRKLVENAEMALRESQARLHLATQAANIGPWDWDLRTNEVFYSREWKRQLGYEAHEIPGHPSEWENRLHPEDRERVMGALRAYLDGASGDYALEFRLRHKDGRYRWIFCRGQMLRDESGAPGRMVGCHVDITDRVQLEEQLRQSTKMEAVGQLAGGVAHDFNNILAAIMMQAELAVGIEGVPPGALELLNDIKLSAERAGNLTRQLLAFSRRQKIQPRHLDLNEIVTNLAKMLQRFLGEEVRMQINLHPMALVTVADAGMLDQALMNLAVNARDAMPQGGRLVIETSEKFITEAEARMIAEADPGPYVCLRVSDNGCGIPPANIRHIFEPFFTTKEPGRGTGLGLATVFGIVKQHRGFIRVDSDVGHGTSFQIFLPSSVKLDKTMAPVSEPPEPRGGHETILLVEDEPKVRALARTALERHGYTVLEAADGLEALQLWESRDRRIDLVLTDMVMPNLNGRELVSRLKQEDPTLKIIFISGYGAELAPPEFKLREGHNFLQKPWPLPRLLETVRQALDD